MCIDARLFFFFFFLPVAALPQWELSFEVGTAAWPVGFLAAPSAQGHDCLRFRSYGPIRVFLQASCSWQSEGLFGQSSSVAPPVQALRSLPCLGSFSVVWCVRHVEGHPWPGSFSVYRASGTWKGSLGGVLLCSLVLQVFDGPGFILFSCRRWLTCGESEAMVMAPPPRRDSALWPCFHGCPAFLRRRFPPQSPPLPPLDPQSTAALALGSRHNP